MKAAELTRSTAALVATLCLLAALFVCASQATAAPVNGYTEPCSGYLEAQPPFNSTFQCENPKSVALGFWSRQPVYTALNPATGSEPCVPAEASKLHDNEGVSYYRFRANHGPGGELRLYLPAGAVAKTDAVKIENQVYFAEAEPGNPASRACFPATAAESPHLSSWKGSKSTSLGVLVVSSAMVAPGFRPSLLVVRDVTKGKLWATYQNEEGASELYAW